MAGPRVTINLDTVERNARTVTEACAKYGVGVIGVTKGTCGMPQVARAMLRGGVIGIGESRFENIARLRSNGVEDTVVLLRSPPLSRVDDTVVLAGISLNSELAVIEALSRAAERRSRVHDVILMVDLGDLREGIWPDDLLPTVAGIVRLPGVRIVGLGTNLTCFGAVLPSERNMGELAGYAMAVEEEFGVHLSYVSGGNSSSLPFLLDGRMPPGINNLRIGESILQGGRDTFFDRPWDALDRTAFLLEGELLEVKVKPSVPIGETGVDAFGGQPVFKNRGDRLRGILNLGREDIVVDALIPETPGVQVLGASSDHLILDLAEVSPPPHVGDVVRFQMGYGALLAAMTSEYVEKQPMFDQPMSRRRRVRLSVDPALREIVDAERLQHDIEALGLSVSADDWDVAAGGGGDDLDAGAALVMRLGTSWEGASAVVDQAAAGEAIGLVWLDDAATLMFADAPVRLPATLAAENIALVGLRHAEAREAEAIKAVPLSAYTIVEVDALGIREVMRRALKAATDGTRGYVAGYYASATDLPGWTPGSGGISARETHQAMEAIAQAPGLRALVVGGLDPATPSVTAHVCDFVLSALGRTIL